MLNVSNLLKNLSKEIVQKARVIANRFAKKIIIPPTEKKLQKALEKKVAVIGNIMGNHLIGLKSPSKGVAIVGGNKYFPEKLSWKALSKKYMDWKGHEKFFILTGKLRQQIMKKDYVSKLGVSVKYTSEERPHKKIGYIEVSLFYRVPKKQLEDLKNNVFRPEMNLEYWMYGHEARTKLKNRITAQRPLVQPVLSYYIRTGLPAEIARVLNKK